MSLVLVMFNTRNIRVLKIESKQQLADIFTKGFAKSTFEYIREFQMGW